MTMKVHSQSALEEPELLTEVPPILKRLAKTTVHGFYESEHIAVVNLLTRIPCIDEDTLIERLRYDKRQLRQTLARLKSDKLIKQRVHKEKDPDSGTMNVYNFYFINYKVFVNVIKYKLDHIRRKLENEEQQARNRPSFTCELCQSKFSDLEVDRLLDMVTGTLKCPHCGGSVEEEMAHSNQGSSRSTLSRFNEQMEPIYKLLRACENINLAPEVLEPEPSTLQLKNILQKNSVHSNSSKSGWSTDKRPVDLYDQSISVNVGDEVNKPSENKKLKEAPVWMTESTVSKSEITPSNSTSSLITDSTQSANVSTIDDILPDLLVHESASKKVRSEHQRAPSVESSDSSADSDSDVGPKQVAGPSDYSEAAVEEMMDDDDDEDPEDDDQSVKVGDLVYNVFAIDKELEAKMTPDEHSAYLKAFHAASEQYS